MKQREETISGIPRTVYECQCGKHHWFEEDINICPICGKEVCNECKGGTVQIVRRPLNIGLDTVKTIGGSTSSICKVCKGCTDKIDLKKWQNEYDARLNSLVVEFNNSLISIVNELNNSNSDKPPF